MENIWMGRNLKGRWEAFISPTSGEAAEATLEEKHLRLEDFLHTFLLMSANPGIDKEDLVNFCNDIHSVFNILVRQFMTDVQVLASTHPSSPPTDVSPTPSPLPSTPSPLMEFLMHGRGWLTLNAMCNLSGQALDFSPDFVCLLVQFVEEALNLPVPGLRKDHNISIPKLEACIPRKSFSKKSLMSIGFANSRRPTWRGHSISNPPSPVRLLASQGSPHCWRNSSRDHMDSSDSDSKTSMGDRRTSKKSGSESSSKHVYSRQAPLPKTALLGEVQIVDWKLSVGNSQCQVSSTDVDAFDLCLVLLSLLERLCVSNVMHSSKRNALALFLAPKLTHLLTYMNRCSVEVKVTESPGVDQDTNDRWSVDLICMLQKLVLRIVVSLCMYSCTQHYEAPKLASSGILFTLLELAKSVGQKSDVTDLKAESRNDTEIPNADFMSGLNEHEAQTDFGRGKLQKVPLFPEPDPWSHLSNTNVQYISEILYGAILLLIGVMHSCCTNQIVVTHAMALLNEFATNGGYSVTESLLVFVDEKIRHFGEEAKESKILKECIVSLLCSLSKLLIATKRAKLEYIHKFQCLKRTHNNCDYTHYTHHHHSMFGISYSTFEDDKVPQSQSKSLPQEGADNTLFRARRSKCCIAVIIEMLLGLLVKVYYKGTTVRILFALEQGGICCCLPPKVIVSVFLRSFKEQSVAMRSYLLSVLGKLILEQLGGGERTEGAIEGICEECSQKDVQSPPATSKEMKISNHYMSSDSAICSDGSQHDEDVHSARWNVLELYTPLLMNEDEVLSQQISGHLLHLVRHGNMVVKEELYFNVILTCFRHSSADNIDGPQKLPCFTAPSVLEHIFCSLPHLLNTLSAQMEFLVEGGLTQLVKLLDLRATRLHVLRVFEVLILSKERQGALLKTRNRSDTKDSALSTRTLSDSGDTCNVVQDFVKIVCNVLQYNPPKETMMVSGLPEGNEPNEDWLQSCEVIEDPIERDVYRSTQNRNVIEERKAAFAESLDTIKEVESSKEIFDSFEEILLMPDQLSKMSEETLMKAADVWRVSGNLLLHSASFQEQFLQTEGDVLATGLLMEALVGLTRMWKLCEGVPITLSPFSEDVARLRTVSELSPAPVNMFQVILDIAGSLLRICLTLQEQATHEEKQTVPRILDNCKGILKQSGILQSVLGRPVAEMLLKVAQMQVYVHPGTHDAGNGTKDCGNNGDDMLHWNLEELQEAVSSDSQSEVSDLLSTEEGYEADSEREREGTHSGDCQGEVDLDRVEVALSQHTLLHPQVCLLLLELLERADGNGELSSEVSAEVTCYSIKQITAIARSSQASQNSLYHCGLPKAALQNYRTSASPAERVLLLELLAVLVQQNLATAELREVLQLFPTSEPVMSEDLLSTLLTIVNSTTTLPSHVINFPVVKPVEEIMLGSASHSSSVSTIITDPKMAPDDQTASEQPRTEPIQVQLGASKSPWNIAPVQLPLRSNFSWPPTGKGVAITTWLRVDELRVLRRLHAVPGFRRKKSFHRQAPMKLSEDQLEEEFLYSEKRKAQRKESTVKPPALQRDGLHLFSVGTRDVMVQVWVDARTCKMTIRLTHFVSLDDHVVLHEATCTNLLSLGVWQHLAVSYEEKAEGLTRTGMISAVVNGHLQRDILMEYTSPGQTKHAQAPVPYCLLGHCMQEDKMNGLPHGSLQLGNVLLFNDAHVLTQELAFHLFTLGPDCMTISACEGSRQSPLYSQYITQDVLHSALSTEIMCGDREVDLRPARESLVISYSPSNKDVFSHYENTAQSGSTLGRVLGGPLRNFPNALLQCPTTVGASLLCTITPHVHRGLQKAIKENGGIGVFVFLFAKIVENCACKAIQAKALKLLFKLRACSPTLAAEFNDMTAASMVSQVLVTPKCIVGFEMLKVMLDACLSKPILYHCSQTNDYRIHRDTQAIIQDAGLVSRLLLDWRVWEKSESGVVQMLFSVMETLIHADHPYQAFNTTQLLSIQCVRRLLMICKERHHEDLPSLAPYTCSSIVSIIKGLMGQPPDVNLLAEVCDFLLAIHPAVNTFVCHAQSSFYFSQHSFKQQKYRQELLRKVSDNANVDDVSESPNFYISSEDLSNTELNHNHQKSVATPDRDNAENAAVSNSRRPFGSQGASNWDEDKASDTSGLCSGLLNLLAEALVVLPDASLSKVLGIVLKPETLIVLAHHESPLIRTRVIQLLDVFFHRASLSQIEGFLKRRSFHLLANQLHQYPATRELMEACLTITIGKPVDMTQGLELMLLQESDRFQHVSSVLLMSLLENSLHDFSLCHDGICVANQLFEGVENIANVMLANGLVETLCNVLSAICSCVSAVNNARRRKTTRASPDVSRRESGDQDIKTAGGNTRRVANDVGNGDGRRQEIASDEICIGVEDRVSSELEKTAATSEGGEPRYHEDNREGGLKPPREGTEPAVRSQKANGFIENHGQESDKLTTVGKHTEMLRSASSSSPSGLDEGDGPGADSQGSSRRSPGGETEISEATLILIEDIQHFMACIANQVFNSSSQFDYFENMMMLLGGMEEQLIAKSGPGSVVSDIVYETQCYIVKEVLDHFRATSMAVDSAVTKGRKVPSLQRSVSYSERKYEEYKWKRRNSIDSGFKVSDSRRRCPSVSSVGSSEFGLSFISESNFEDTMSLSSEQDRLSDFSQQAEDRRYSSQLDTILRMQRVRASSTSGRPASRRKTPESAGEQLLAKRFQRICLLTVNLVFQRDPCRMETDKSADTEDGFAQPVESTFTQLTKRLFNLLTGALAATMERKLGQRKQWESILWSSRDTLRLQLHRLLVQMIAPWQPTPIRVYMLQIACVPRANQILQTVLSSSLQQHLGKFELFLFDLLHNHGAELTEANVVLCQQLMDVLEKCGLHPLYQEDMDETTQDRVEIELEKMVTEEQSSQEAYTKQRLDGAASTWTKLDPFAKEVANSAMEVTQLVAAYQNGQRLRFLEFLKSTIASSLDVRSAWQDLIESLTHERAVWYDPVTYPSSWQLDPTEGPGRVRRRLQRCHLYIADRFLLPHRRENYRCHPPVPLGYLFEDSRHSSNSSEFKRRLQKNEKISCAFFCNLVTPALVNKGDLLQGVSSMYFVSEELPDSSKAQVNLFERDMMTISWLYEDIKELHLRWYQLRDHGLEIFLTNGQTLLLAFENTKERDTLYQQIKSCDLPNLVEVDDISDVTQAWRLGQMTNYEYLTQLNKLSGRSFNDLMQYPVFPFVLSDYTSKVLDLENPNSYRDLTRPVAVQTQAMESRYKENYKFLKEEYQKLKGLRMEKTMFWTKPYHYGSHYSNSGTVLQFLVRLPPFTKMFLHYQDNHFDLPDRTFHSVDTSWRLSSFQSSTDVKELIPEFFFLPEFLTNNEGFNFGVRQSGASVHDVILPPWAKDSARLFMLIHRQALESVYTSKFLHAWVDLVFGVKQQGTLAVESINVFHPATYFGIDTTTIQDPVKQRAVETMIKTYGQTPKQLFVNYHPSRLEHDIFPDSVGMGSVGILVGLSQRQPTKANTGPEASNISWPVNTVMGMRWGNYLGSASGLDPVIRYTKHYPVPLTALVPLPTGDICGVAQHLCLLLMYSKEKGVSSMNAIDIKWSGIVSWGHPDGILRVQIRRKSLPINLLHATPTDKITCCTSVSDCRLLFIGTVSGGITAYPTRYSPDKQCNIEVVGAAVRLFGHTARINSLCVCRPYSIMVSASEDGSCIIWDLNRLCYVRSLCDDATNGDRSGVTAVAVSDVSGDIAVATTSVGGGSDVCLWTINARLATRRLCDSCVHCLAFSSAPEGIAVNSLVAGCEDGVVRFWSTIDLAPIRVLVGNSYSPIICLAFTCDSLFLLASNKDGLVVAWGNKETNRRVPKIEAFLGMRKLRNPSSSRIGSVGSQ